MTYYNLAAITLAGFIAIDGFICKLIDVALDSFPIVFLSYVTALFNDLSEKLKRFGEDVKKKDESEVSQSLKSDRIIKDLIRCVELHLKLKKFTCNIEKHFSTIIFLQGFFSTTAYTLTTVRRTLNLI